MFNMEFAEVVTPHFAVPVVGVVLCALLVYAFGFKSPVQPPSFDFEHEERRGKKAKKPKKPPTNGHIVNVDANHVPVVSKPAAKATPKQMTEKEQPPTAKPKAKKTSTPKASKSETGSKPALKKTEDDVSGEWTTALSRKEKKMRGKKDDGKKDDADTVAMETMDAQEQIEATTPIVEVAPKEAPQEQRSKKEKKKKESPKPAPEPEKAPAVEKVEEKTPKAVEKSPKEEKKLVEKKAAPVDKYQASLEAALAEAAGMVVMAETTQEEEVVVEEKPASPKRNKKTKKNRPANTEAEETKPTEDTSASEQPKAVAPEPAVGPAGDMGLSLAEEAKPARSPKKKKKASRQPEASVISTPDTSRLTEVPKPQAEAEVPSPVTPQPQTQAKVASIPSEPVAEISPAVTTEDSSNSSSAKPTSNIAFDEVGEEWQEAKPGKKKKKARREN